MDFPIKIKRYRSSRSLKLRIDEKGNVVVTAHTLTPTSHINTFVNQHSDWINQQLSKISSEQNHLTQARQTLLFRGKDYQFLLAVGKSEKVEIDNNKITVFSQQEDHHQVRKNLEKWYKKQAKSYFGARVLLLADLVNSDVKTVTIRSQKTRWGSCSSRLTISLNWRLILCPDWVSDYVIYHELAHLTHMNHSQKFWQLLGEYYPKIAEAEKWLKQNHALLKF